MSEELDREKYDEDNLPPVPEPTTTFKNFTDRDVYKVVSEKDPNTTLIEISGYDLHIGFNMKYLNTLEDIDAATEAIAALFRDVIMDRLLEYKPQS